MPPPSPVLDERSALVELERLEAEHRELSASVELARKTLADRRLQGGVPAERPSNLAHVVILAAIVFAFLAAGARILSRQDQRETDQAARSL